MISTLVDSQAEGDETAVLSLTSTDNFVEFGANNPATLTIVDDPPLQVDGVVINGGASQRSNLETIEVKFSRGTNLQALIDSGEIGQVVQVWGATQFSLNANHYRYNAATNTLSIDLTVDGFGGSTATRLADGRFELRMDTTRIYAQASPSRQLVDSDGLVDQVFRSQFHRLHGDFDGNAAVNQSDVDLFMAHYGGVRGKNALYDVLYDLTSASGQADGNINTLDYTYLRKRLGRTI